MRKTMRALIPVLALMLILSACGTKTAPNAPEETASMAETEAAQTAEGGETK